MRAASPRSPSSIGPMLSKPAIMTTQLCIASRQCTRPEQSSNNRAQPPNNNSIRLKNNAISRSVREGGSACRDAARCDEAAVGHEVLREGAGAGGVEAGDVADLLVGQRTARGGGEHGIDVGRIRGR